MCLIVDSQNTAKMKAYLKRYGKVLVMKQLTYSPKAKVKLTTPYMATRVYINPETLEFSTKSSLNSKIEFSGMVTKGIHAYFWSKKGAKIAMKSNRRKLYNDKFNCYILLRAWVYEEDFVAMNVANDTIVAKRIFFHEDDVIVEE